MTEIAELQRKNLKTLQAIATAARAPAPSDSVLGELITRRLEANRTVFPRRAAYSIMVNAGQLEDITDPELRLAIAELYDHDFVRIQNAGSLSDEISFAFRFGVLEFWDYELQRHLDSPAAALKTSNLAHRFIVYNTFYLEMIDRTLASVRNVRQAILDYLGESGKDL